MLQRYKSANFNSSEALKVSTDLKDLFKKRRSIREFKKKSFPKKIVENAIEMASSAPSGANKQPWTFCLVENDAIKAKIREDAESVEKDFYIDRPNENWLKDLKSLGTNETKEFLSEAPYLIVIFAKNYEKDKNQKVSKSYYANESVGIATGFLIACLHMAGLATLTYTPKKMKFLNKLLDRGSNERPFLILVVGEAKQDVQVPQLNKKTIGQVLEFYQQPSQGDLDETIN